MSNNYRDLLLVTLHLQRVAYLDETNSAFTVAKANNFVKRAKQLECASDDLALGGASTHVGDDAGE